MISQDRVGKLFVKYGYPITFKKLTVSDIFNEETGQYEKTSFKEKKIQAIRTEFKTIIKSLKDAGVTITESTKSLMIFCDSQIHVPEVGDYVIDEGCECKVVYASGIFFKKEQMYWDIAIEQVI